jgi:hypothetical protein
MQGHMLFGLAGAGSAQGAFTVMFDWPGVTVDTADRSTYTFTTPPVYPALLTGDKMLLGLAVDDSGANSTTSVTYDGNAMTRVVGPVSAANDYIEIWELNAPSFIDQERPIVVTLANTALGVTFLGVNLRGFASAAVYDTATSTADPASLTIDVPEGGAIFGLAHATGATASIAWSSLSTLQGNDNQLGSQVADWAGSAGLPAETSRAVSVNYDLAANFKAAAVSYG